MKFHQIDLLDGYCSVQLPKHVFFFINEVLRSIEVPSAACSTLLLPPLFASLGIREVMDRKPCDDDKPCAVYSPSTCTHRFHRTRSHVLLLTTKIAVKFFLFIEKQSWILLLWDPFILITII